MIHKSIQSALANLYFFAQIAIKQSVKALTKPHAQTSAQISAVKRASDQASAQASPTKHWSYIINCVGFGLALLLSACTYNGLSGSSGVGGDTTAINGLWIQQEQATLTSGTPTGENCGCRNGGGLSGDPRRCFSYFSDGIVISGYLTADDASADDCANKFPLDADARNTLHQALSNMARNTGPGNVALNGAFQGAVGSFNFQQNDAPVNIEGRQATGVHFDIRYPGGRNGLIGRDIACTSYAVRGSALYIAGDPSGGGQAQPQDPTACNTARFTSLVRYEKVSPE